MEGTETQKEREGSRDAEKERRPRVWGQRPGEGTESPREAYRAGEQRPKVGG